MESNVHVGEAGGTLRTRCARRARTGRGRGAYRRLCGVPAASRRGGGDASGARAREQGRRTPAQPGQRSTDGPAPQDFYVVGAGSDRGCLHSRMADPAFCFATRRRNARDDQQPLLARAVQRRRTPGQGHLRARSILVLRYRLRQPAVRCLRDSRNAIHAARNDGAAKRDQRTLRPRATAFRKSRAPRRNCAR